MPRDLVKEIEAVRDRTRISDHMAAAISLLVLKGRLDDARSDESELFAYFPVAVVAHLEVFLRHALRDLLDHGDPYITRINRLLKDGRLKFDSSVISALAGQRVTLGELVAHSLGYSDLSRVCGYFSEVLDRDFLRVLGQHVKEDDTPLDQVLPTLQKLYETRHRIAHEVRHGTQVTKGLADEWIEAAFGFMKPAMALFEAELYPGAPTTQADMNELARSEALAALHRVEEATGVIAATRPLHADALQRLHKAWQTRAMESAELVVDLLGIRDGSAAPVLRWQAVEQAADAELERLEEISEKLGQVHP